MHKCLVSRVRPPSMFVSGLSPRLDEMVLRGLARDPRGRYPTARQMALDIEEAVAAIRPSEVAAWVERLSGPSLAARAAVVAKMERTPSPIAPDSRKTIPAPTVPAPSGGAPPPSARPSATSPIFVDALLSGMDSSVSGVTSSRRDTARPRKRLSPFAVAAALLASFVPLALAMVVSQRSAARADRTPLPAPLLTAFAAPPSAPEALPPPVAHIPVDPPRPPTPPPPAPSTPPPSRAKLRPSAKPAPVTAPMPPAPPNCAPPYSVDSVGRQIFKLECL